MNLFDGCLLLGVIGLVACPFVSALALYGLKSPQHANEQNVRERARVMQRSGRILLVIGVLCAAFTLSVLVAHLTRPDRWNNSGDTVVAFAVITMGFNAWNGFFAGAVLMFHQKKLRQAIDDCRKQIQQTNETCSVIRRCVLGLHAVFLIPLSLLFPPLFFIAFVLVGAWIPIALLLGGGRNASQLLLALTIAVKHGRPLVTELESFAIGARPRLRSRVRLLISHLEDGCTLGEALEFGPKLLPKWMVSAIRTAEQSGTLEPTLQQLLKQQTELLSSDPTRASTMGWLTYGVIYTWLASLIVGFLMVFIVPKLKHIFEGFGTELPNRSIAMFELTEFMGEYWFLFAPVGYLGSHLMLELMRAEVSGGRSLRLPFLHRLYLALDAPDVLRHLAGAVKAGRLLPDVLNALSRFHFRPSIARSLGRVATAANEGCDAFEALRAQRFLSENDLLFLTSAQQVGNVDWALNELAEIRDRRRSYRLQMLMEFVRPVPIVIGGIITFMIVVSFFLPIVKLLNDLS